MSNSSFLRHAGVYGLGTILLQAAGVFLLPLYMHHLQTAEFGTLEVLNRIGSVVVLALLFGGIRQATLAFMGQSVTVVQRQKTIASLLVFVLLQVAGGTSIIAVTSEWWCRQLNFASPELLRLAITSALLDAAMLVLLAVSQARQESTLYVAVSVGQFVLRVGVVIVFVVGLEWGVKGILSASIIVSGLISCFLAVREIALGARQADWLRMRTMASFTLPLLPCAVGFFLLNSGDRFFLLRYSGEEEVGIYALGYKLAVSVGTLVWAPLAMVWSARMYQVAREPDAALQFGIALTRMAAPYIFCGLGLSLFASEIVALLGGGDYMAAAKIIPPVILAQLCLVIANWMDGGFYIRRITYHKTWIVLVSAPSTFALYYWLIPRWNSMGAAMATLLGFTFHAILTRLVSQRVFTIRYETIRLSAMFALAVGLFLASRLLSPGWSGILAKVGLLVCWPMGLWLSGIVTNEEKAHVTALLTKIRALVEKPRRA